MIDTVTKASRLFAGYSASDDRVTLKDIGDGRLFQLDLAPSDVGVASVSGPRILGTLDGQKHASDSAAPVRRVRKQYGKLQQFVLSSDLTKLVRSMGGAAGAQPPRVNPGVAARNYSCKEFTLDVSVPTEVIANADQDLGSALGFAARDTWSLMREYKVAQMLTTSSNWATTQVIAGSNWSVAGNPILDLFKGLQVARNPRPNLLIMSETIGRYWYSNATVQSFYMTGALEELGLKVVTIGAKVTSGGAVADIWSSVGNHAVLLHTGPSDTITTAATARWSGDEIRGVPQGEIWVMVEDVLLRTFWEPRGGARGLSGCVIATNEDIVMIDSTLGALITTVA